MKRTIRTGGGNVYDQIALKLREIVHGVHLNEGSGAERFQVTQTSPLVIEALHSDLQLEVGDPDFTIGQAVTTKLDALEVGDMVWCLREDNEWHAVDVAAEDPS